MSLKDAIEYVTEYGPLDEPSGPRAKYDKDGKVRGTLTPVADDESDSLE